MSQLLINEYLNDLATLKRVSGAQRESVVREAFKDLLKKWGKTSSPSTNSSPRPRCATTSTAP